MSDELSTTEAIKTMVEDIGSNNVAINEPPCMLWKAEHKNCKGCEYEVGCAKVVSILLATMQGAIYTPKDFNDFRAMQVTITKTIESILKSKTSEEVHAILNKVE